MLFQTDASAKGRCSLIPGAATTLFAELGANDLFVLTFERPFAGDPGIFSPN